ncbi:MAG: hypothetical protein JWM74_4165 [Myxococcaceae bacterium]|nr:hypothetical protein [Myxococcaceae bacterium]
MRGAASDVTLPGEENFARVDLAMRRVVAVLYVRASVAAGEGIEERLVHAWALSAEHANGFVVYAMIDPKRWRVRIDCEFVE